jgi:hypothetical protein
MLLPLYLRGRSPRYSLDRILAGPRVGLDAVKTRKLLYNQCWNASIYISIPRLTVGIYWIECSCGVADVGPILND